MSWGAVALAAVSVVSRFASYRQQKKAGKLQSRARELQNMQAGLESDRRRRAFLNEAQRAGASTIAESVAMGGGAGGLESSTVQGAQSSLFSQIGSELSFFASQSLLGEQGAMFENKAQERLNRANLFSTIAGAAGTGASAMGGGSG